MMEVYLGALRDSQNGKNQYVIERGLDIFRTSDPDSVAYYLTGGWDIKAVCRNGILHEDWRLTASDDPVLSRVFAILGLERDEKDISIHVQTHVNYAGNIEHISMRLVIRKPEGKGAEMRWVAAENFSNREAYRRGQEKAKSVLDYLLTYSVKQDKEGLLERLRMEKAIAF